MGLYAGTAGERIGVWCPRTQVALFFSSTSYEILRACHFRCHRL